MQLIDMQDKIYRKLHNIFWQKLKPGKWSLWLYPAFRHYRFSSKKNNNLDMSGVYLTQEPNRGAGIGHQLGNWLSGYCISQKLGVNYAYSEFPGVSMGEKDSWDYFLSFGDNEVYAKHLIKDGYKKRRLPYINAEKEEDVELLKNIVNSYSGKKVVFYLELDQYYFNIQESSGHIKKKFNEAKARENDKLVYDNNVINVAVHIRRGDIVAGQGTDNKALTKRWLTNDYYKKILEDLIKEQLKDKAYKIYVFSQGKEEDFPELKAIPNIEWCFDMSAKDSFLHMIKADILVISKSSFSYKPALLNDGIKIVPSHFWHGYPEDDSWIKVEE